MPLLVGDELQQVAEALATRVALVDCDERYRYVNHAYAEMVRRPTDRIIGSTVKEVLGPANYAFAGPRLAAALRGERQQYEFPLIGRGDPEPRTMQVTLLPQCSYDGRVSGCVAEVIDVTDQSRARASLQATQQAASETLAFLEMIQQQAPIGIGYVDREFRFQRVNQQLATINGLDIADMLGHTVAEALPTVWEQVETYFQRALLGEAVQNIGKTTNKNDDSESRRHYVVNYYPVRPTPTEEAAGVGVVVADVTEIKRSLQGLRDSESRLRLAQEAAGVGTYVVDLVAGTVWHSPELASWVGTLPATPIPLEEGFRPIHPDDLPLVKAELAKAMNPEGDGKVRFEFRIYNPKGEVRWLSAAGEVEYRETEAGRTPFRHVGMCIDVTERKRSQTSIEQAARLVSLSTLTAGLAHEIHNPLSAAWTSAHAARMALGDPKRGRIVEEALTNIVDSVQRCREIINSLRAFAIDDRGNRKLHDLNALIGRAVDEVVARRPSARIATQLAETPRLLLDETAIGRAIVNLIDNAVQSAEDQVQVWVRTGVTAGEVLVAVEDDGPGMPTAVVERVFEPFFTTKQNGGGMGLGLSIVHGIITKHGGSIAVDSWQGSGTRFLIRLPIEESAAANLGISPISAS